MNILGICGSVAPSRRTKKLVEVVLDSARNTGAAIDILDLSETALEFCDGRRYEDYGDATRRALEKVKCADAFVIGSPMYRGSITGALKNLMDLIPVEFMRGKAAGMVATGGSFHHYLGMDLQLRGIMSFFQVHTLPGIVYAAGSQITSNAGELLVDEDLKGHAEKFGLDLVELTNVTSGRILGTALF